jgi:hypothetical protein
MKSIYTHCHYRHSVLSKIKGEVDMSLEREKLIYSFLKLVFKYFHIVFLEISF